MAAEFEAAFLVLGSLYGLGTRLGYRIEAGPVVVTPEGSFEWLIPDRGTNFGRAAGGLRFSLRGTVEPALFAHVGVIFDENNSDSAFDAGFSVDVHVLPIAALGVHAAVNRWSDSGFLFETLGIHASFTPFASLSERHTHASR